MRKTMTTKSYIKKMYPEMSDKMTIKEAIEEIVNNARFDIETYCGERFRHMQAREYGDVLQSYNTYVAWFDGCNVLEFGYYSVTTSKQVTKWNEERHSGDIIRLTDWEEEATKQGAYISNIGIYR